MTRCIAESAIMLIASNPAVTMLKRAARGRDRADDLALTSGGSASTWTTGAKS
ncbi:MAG: hypothetical protein JWQ59_771 [Cryobacterium sp.]|nr:hypothetical protein [Cryobacterium sp.]